MEEEEDIFGEEFSSDSDGITNIPGTEAIIQDGEVEDLFETTNSPIVEKLLENRGIIDSKVNILDENDEQVEVNFNELPLDEQLAILTETSEQPVVNNGLTDVDAQFFETLKNNNMDANQYLAAFKESIIKEVQPEAIEDNYDIDGYDDKELFLLDLKAKYDLTDDELSLELDRALENEAVFNKKITKTREEYKTLEDQHKADQKRIVDEKIELEHKTYSDNLIQTAVDIPEFHGIEIENDEKNAVLGDLLEKGPDGLNSFQRDIKNPAREFEAAWFMRYGKEAFKALSSAYEEEIERLKKDNKPTRKTKVVVQKQKADNADIFDLNF